jgi:multicomponent Na+:H+ antiporter subunit F
LAETLYSMSALIALAGIVIAFIRLVLGPSAADRTVALDAMTIITISLIAWLGYMLGRKIYLDVAMVYGLISFIGVVAVARYLERGL